MANKGWIRIHRQLQDCVIWVDNEPFDRRSAWIDLLMSANHEDKDIIFDYKSVTIKRGQYLTSVRKLGERWSWSKNRVLKYLRLLEELKMITRVSDGRRTVITIENYDKYQSQQDSDMDTDVYAPMDSGMDSDMDSDMPQTIMKKNEKNEKNIKNIYGEYRHVRLTKKEYDKLITEFGESETLEAIKFLDEYKQRKGYKSKDDNLTIRKWVFDAVKREKGQPSQQVNKKIHNYDERDYDFDELMKMATGGNG